MKLTPNELWLAIGGMALVTFGVRYLPMLAARRMTLPPRLMDALRYVPVAVLSAIIAPAILYPNGVDLHIGLDNPRLLAGIASALIMWRSKNLLLTIVLGMGLFLLLQALI